MTDAPETIWVGPNTSEQWDFGDWDLTGDGIVYAEHATPYIRADLSDARVAQAREDALREAAEKAGEAAVNVLLRHEPDASALRRQTAKQAAKTFILALISEDKTNG